MKDSKIFGFKNRYPQSFLDQLAKDLGIEWTKVEFKTLDKEDVPICPLPPPTGNLYYFDYDLKDNND